MFTGIVQELLTITAIDRATATTVALTLPKWGILQIGESILLAGICSTVTAVTGTSFTVDYMAETLAKTTVERWQIGDQIHAEPSATLQTKLSGNLVYGHVDGTAEVIMVTPLQLRLPTTALPYVVVKGAITINGVNLTIVDIVDHTITIELVPHTAAVTTLAKLQSGDRVNIELDYLTKVVVQTVQHRLK